MIQSDQAQVELSNLCEEDLSKAAFNQSKSTLDSFLLPFKRESILKDAQDTANSSSKMLNRKRTIKPKSKKVPAVKEKRNYNSCFQCKKRGDLLLCDGCPKSYHKSCINIEDFEDNVEEWFCKDCIAKKERLAKTGSKSRSGANTTSKIPSQISSSNMKQSKIDNYSAILNLQDTNTSTESPQNASKDFKGGSKINKYIIGDQEPSNLNFSKVLDPVTEIVKYNGDRLLNEPSDPYLESLTFDQLNNLNTIIEEVIKKEKIHSFVKAYIQGSYISNTDAYRSSHSKKKKKKKKKVSSSHNQTRTSKSGCKDTGRKSTKPTPKDKELESKRRDQEQKLQEEINRKLEEKKYHNVRYPIDDTELYGKWRRYKLDEKYLNKSEPCKSLIPNKLFLSIYKICDFIHTFSEVLKLSNDFSVDMLYSSIASNNLGQSAILKEIVVSLLSLLTDQTKELEYKAETPEVMTKDEYLFKSIFKYPKWKKELILGVCFTLLINALANSEKYSSMSSPQLVNLLSRLSSNTECYAFFQEPIHNKLMIVNFLMNCCLSTEVIRSLIQNHITRKVDLKREKIALEAELRILEAKKKDYDKLEKRNKPTEKIAELNSVLSRLTEDFKHLGRKELMIKRKELEAEREQFKSTVKEIEESESKKVKLAIKLEKIINDLNILSINSQRLIGTDGLGNKYFIFKGRNNVTRIHVKSLSNEWGFYSSEKHIQELQKTLTEKGKAERHLIEKLKGINPKYYSCTLNENDQMTISELIEAWNSSNKSKVKDSEMIFNSHPLKDYNAIAIKVIITSLAELEQAMSENLFKDNKEWDVFEVRSEFLAYLRNTSEAKVFGKLLLLMNESFAKPLFIIKKYNNLSSKIIEEDDYNEIKPSITDNFNKINPNYKSEFSKVNEEYRKLQGQACIWKEFRETNLEGYFVEKAETAVTLTEIVVLSQLFVSVVTGWLISFNKNHNWKIKDDSDLKEKENKLEIRYDALTSATIINERQTRIRRQAVEHLDEHHVNQKNIVSEHNKYLGLG